MAMNFGKLNFAVGFNRTSAFPLDANSYFESYDAAVTAAAGAAEVGSADSAYYVGQLIIVKDTAKGVGLYQIGADKTLVKFGQASSADELTTDLKALKARFNNLVRDLPVSEQEDGSFQLEEPTADKMGFFKYDEKTKLAGIESGAQVNKIESIKVNGTALDITDKSVNIETEDLDTVLANYATNDSVTEKVNAVDAKVTKNTNDISTINSKLTGLTGAMHFKGVVTEVPTDLTDYEIGDVVVVHNSESKNDKKEFVVAEVDGIKAFVELGDEGSHLTKTEAESTYLKQADASTTYATKNELSSAQTTLQGNIDKKANQTDLTTLETKVNGHTTSIEGIETAIGDSTNPAEDTILGRIKAAENNLTSISNTIGSSTDTWDGTKNTIFAHIDHLQTQITSNASANVSTDRLVNGSKTLILNGGGAAKFETEE